MGWFTRRQRSDEVDAFPREWDDLLRRRWQLWRRYGDDERELLGALIETFVATRRWEAARDWTVTTEMQVLVAASASALVLGFRDELAQGIDPWRRVGSIIVHPADMVQHGERPAGSGGIMADGPTWLSGEAHLGGPVLLSWRAITSDLAHPGRGRNVVVHEFAHQLDMLDGDADGVPPMSDDARDRWEGVMAQHLRAVRTGRSSELLDAYAAKDEVELFAVASELFFTRPHLMADELADLYAVLAAYYRQDLAALFASDAP